MNTNRMYLTLPSVARRRRPPARRLELFTPMPKPRTPTAPYDAEHAEQLIADLLALVDCGLVTPLRDLDGQTRYAITQGNGPHDCPRRTTTRSEFTR